MKNRKFSIIAAMAENRVIGSDGDLPWHLPDDLKFFKKTTKGHTIIMGRKTFESFGSKPLPYRENVIISRNMKEKTGIFVCRSLDEAIKLALQKEDEQPFIIGGGTLYEQGLEFTQKVYLTRIHTEVDGDTYFPELPKSEWELKESEYHPKDKRHNYDFTFEFYSRKV